MQVINWPLAVSSILMFLFVYTLFIYVFFYNMPLSTFCFSMCCFKFVIVLTICFAFFSTNSVIINVFNHALFSSYSTLCFFLNILQPVLMVLVFQVMRVDRPLDTLPTAQTCFFQLRLPPYSSQEVMAERLRYAINNCRSIDMDNYMLARNQDPNHHSDDDEF